MRIMIAIAYLKKIMRVKAIDQKSQRMKMRNILTDGLMNLTINELNKIKITYF